MNERFERHSKRMDGIEDKFDDVYVTIDQNKSIIFDEFEKLKTI